jgi:hypothetical protein
MSCISNNGENRYVNRYQPLCFLPSLSAWLTPIQFKIRSTVAPVMQRSRVTGFTQSMEPELPFGLS